MNRVVRVAAICAVACLVLASTSPLISNRNAELAIALKQVETTLIPARVYLVQIFMSIAIAGSIVGILLLFFSGNNRLRAGKALRLMVSSSLTWLALVGIQWLFNAIDAAYTVKL